MVLRIGYTSRASPILAPDSGSGRPGAERNHRWAAGLFLYQSLDAIDG